MQSESKGMVKPVKGENAGQSYHSFPNVGGLAGWFLRKLTSRGVSRPRMAVLERIALAPRQSLALIEVEGRRFLIATSPDGPPVFQSLDGTARARRNYRGTRRLLPPGGARSRADSCRWEPKDAEAVSW